MTFKHQRWWMLLIVSLFAHPVTAVQNDFVGWYGVTTQGRLGFLTPALKNFGWNSLYQARVGRAHTDLLESLLFFQIDYYFHRQLRVSVGYAHDWLENFHENRVYEEIGWTSDSAAWGSLTTRTRMEQRIHSQAPTDNVGWRLREFAQWRHPLPGADWIDILVNDEIFIYLNSSAWRNDGFGENRFFAGIDLPMTDRTRLSLGYMNQFVRSNRSRNHLINHILFMNLGMTF